ncbi:aldo/keto reductase [Sphingomonas sp. QA11]|uniref:aldo/keto reductase n=1 Tax=Sphingomonas sp. QA11 TaxID=2950605 RepID=UPI0023495B70|nr:aldo/keto reductase [Sphingomonas sp. QA11]WCM28635.1 aldo/keto reductase [Sphingomonas sp. QA11]
MARLAASGLFGFGASSLGNLYREVTDAEARGAVEAAWINGIRYFDTAPFYGFGLSERRLGDALRGYDRNDYILSTKAGRLLFPAETRGVRDGFHSPMPFAPVFDYSYDGVMWSFEASLHRLGLDRIDILLMHDLGGSTHGSNHRRMSEQAINGGFRALMELRDQGVVSAIGLGVNEIAVCEDSVAHADFDLFLIAGRLSLLDQSASSFFDICRKRGVGILAAGVFSSGILATGPASPAARHAYAPASEGVRARVEAIERICRAFDVSLPSAALRFVARHSGVTLPVIGVSNAAEVYAAVEFSRISLPDALWEALAPVLQTGDPPA